jgi:phage N-6-adenine-methyltransferase
MGGEGVSINDGMFTSATCEWETPQAFFDKWHKEFDFTLDACATSSNAKCARYFTKEQDGLSRAWTGRVWMNPPYGREIGKWVRKAYEEAQNGCTVVCLLPARTDTAWWHDYCAKGEIHFVRGRLKFGGSKWNAPFPNAVVIFWPGRWTHDDIQRRIWHRRRQEASV